MKAFKYCEYNRCKNYKKRNLKMCYVHEKKTRSMHMNILQLFFFITLMISMSIYLYVEHLNVYVNTAILDYKTILHYKSILDVKISGYIIIDSLVNNVSEIYIRVYNDLLQVSLVFIRYFKMILDFYFV